MDNPDAQVMGATDPSNEGIIAIEYVDDALVSLQVASQNYMMPTLHPATLGMSLSTYLQTLTAKFLY